MERMRVVSEEKADLGAYQLMEVAKVWFTQWKFDRVDKGLIGWEVFKVIFLDHFFPPKLSEVKVIEFVNLKQGKISLR